MVLNVTETSVSEVNVLIIGSYIMVSSQQEPLRRIAAYFVRKFSRLVRIAGDNFCYHQLFLLILGMSQLETELSGKMSVLETSGPK